MKLKHAIVQVMARDSLKAAIDELELDGVDRRSAEDMAARLSRSRAATPEVLLGVLGKQQVKDVCELVGLDSTGRRKRDSGHPPFEETRDTHLFGTPFGILIPTLESDEQILDISYMDDILVVGLVSSARPGECSRSRGSWICQVGAVSRAYGICVPGPGSKRRGSG